MLSVYWLPKTQSRQTFSIVTTSPHAPIRQTMARMRTLLHTHARLAMLLVVMALLVKALLPAGYMLAPSNKSFTVTICADGSGEMQTRTVTVPVQNGEHGGKVDHAQSGKGCAYSALSIASTAGADVSLLVLALAFILLVGLAPAPQLSVAIPHHLRPPLRGPPAQA